jgi:hypothetical protein
VDVQVQIAGDNAPRIVEAVMGWACIIFGRIAETGGPPMRKLFALAACLISVAAAAQSRSDAATMIRLWHEANLQCRGGAGDDQSTHDACDEREAYGKRLDALGWCYGRKGESGYQMKWHRCTARSFRHGD